MTNDNSSKKVGEFQLNNLPVHATTAILASNSLPLPIEAEILRPARLIADPEPGISVRRLQDYLSSLLAKGKATALLNVRFAGDVDHVQFNSITVASFHERLSSPGLLDTSGDLIDICVGYKSARLKSVEFDMTESSLGEEGAGEDIGTLSFYCEGESQAEERNVIGMLMKDEDDPYGGYETSVGDILETLHSGISEGRLTERSPFRIYANGVYVQPHTIRGVTATAVDLADPVNAEENAALNSYRRYNVNNFEICVEAEEDFESKKMLAHIQDMRERSVFEKMRACPKNARKVIEDARYVAARAGKEGMTVEQLHDFLGILMTAGMSEARLESANTAAPVTKAECHLSYIDGRDAIVSPINDEEAAAVVSNERLNSGWLTLHSGAAVSHAEYGRLYELYDEMEARSNSAQNTGQELQVA